VAEEHERNVIAREGTELASAYLELKQQYDQLVRKNLAGVFRTTVQGRFVECNDSMARMLGYTDREALMAVKAQDLYVDAGDRERFLFDLREHKQLVNYEAVLKHAQGHHVHVLENVFFHEPPDRPATIDGTVIDITTIRQAELEQRALLNNYRQLMDRVRDGILIVRDDHVLYANPSAGPAMAGCTVRRTRTPRRPGSRERGALLTLLATDHGYIRYTHLFRRRYLA
jgi:PAS domain S-box-containing protein